MSARYCVEGFLITHLCLVLSSAKVHSLSVVFFPSCLKPPACYRKQMLSRLYYFSKHSYPLPCYFLWSARLATLTFFFLPSSPLTPSDPHTDTQTPSRFLILLFFIFASILYLLFLRADRGATVVSGSCGCLKFRLSVLLCTVLHLIFLNLTYVTFILKVINFLA